jgi:hypothetical protein
MKNMKDKMEDKIGVPWENQQIRTSMPQFQTKFYLDQYIQNLRSRPTSERLWATFTE